ncbi:MAG: 7-cyano-7-deazaguanine synthase [Flavobacterium nitrogenifigens]|uniref:7-cyano-7-deazaguanine synthase n=1 Tax=Flavobacterium nitrogenifigens TaxID=1617283 RepID=UPI0028097978|nr:7-cyano-7-deazaguanine synthase [Flavobacterium nitrogenifigens]MDQ8014951.1 7-cyano-7-deazaguanine synthase [Flavobacterium nitrogenifigens]
MEPVKKAILLSGGIDSICLAYHLKPDIAYTIDYGQVPAEREIYVSNFICQKIGIKHKVITVDCQNLGSGTLANSNNLKISPSEEWWPFRNQLLITLASMQGIKDSISELYLASVKSDGFHRDGTKNFYKLSNELVSYQEGGIQILCPTLEYFSHELVTKFNVPFELLSIAHSCHISNISCGKCSGCLKQLRVRHEINMK